MPVHDWTRVEAGIFHDFHMVWTVLLRNALNEGLLPKGYYALAEQHAGRAIADILTLHASPEPHGTGMVAAGYGRHRRRRGTASSVAQADRGAVALGRRRSLAIRHVSGHRLIALIEIVSPANKDRAQHVEELVDKAVAALERRRSCPSDRPLSPWPARSFRDSWRHRPGPGRMTAIRTYLPPDTPLTLASYVAGPHGGDLPRTSGRRSRARGDAAVSPGRPLRQRAARIDLPGHLPGRARILPRPSRRTNARSELTTITTSPRPAPAPAESAADRTTARKPAAGPAITRSRRAAAVARRSRHRRQRLIHGGDRAVDVVHEPPRRVIRRVDRLVPIGRLGVQAGEGLGPAVGKSEDDRIREQPLEDPAAILGLDVVDLGAADVLLQPGDLLPGDPAFLSLARHDPAGDHDNDRRQDARDRERQDEDPADHPELDQGAQAQCDGQRQQAEAEKRAPDRLGVAVEVTPLAQALDRGRLSLRR